VAVKITIVGCGPGSPDYLTRAAVQAVESSDVLIGAQRLLDLFPGSKALKIAAGGKVAETLDHIAAHAEAASVAVLVSGDPGIFSLSKRVLARFGRDACAVIPGISSVQAAFARVGIDWADARLISAHKEDPDHATAEALRQESKIAVFAGRTASLVWIGTLLERLGPGYRVIACENLTLPNEHVRTVRPDEVASLTLSSSAIILIILESAWDGR
jgi:precorrin-6y C5,15-methyltransferase (decarboxylating) CbiE subunit